MNRLTLTLLATALVVAACATPRSIAPAIADEPAAAPLEPHAQPRAAAPPEATQSEDALTLSMADATLRWTHVSVRQSHDGFRTDLEAQPTGDQRSVLGIELVLIRLRGPGTYPLGFAWDRGESRATFALWNGQKCMTPSEDAGEVKVTVAPADRTLAAGDRLEGYYRVRCFPNADPKSPDGPKEFSGSFAVTVQAQK